MITEAEVLLTGSVAKVATEWDNRGGSWVNYESRGDDDRAGNGFWDRQTLTYQGLTEGASIMTYLVMLIIIIDQIN